MIKSNEEIELLRIAGKIVGDTHNFLKQYIKNHKKLRKINIILHFFTIPLLL